MVGWNDILRFLLELGAGLAVLNAVVMLCPPPLLTHTEAGRHAALARRPQEA